MIAKKSGKRTDSRVIATGVFTALMAVVMVAVLVPAGAYENAHRAAYDTGSEYQVTGHIVKASVEKGGPEFLPASSRFPVYQTVIEAEGLPNGETVYESNRQSDWVLAKDANPEALYTITIGNGGYLVSVDA